MGQGAESGTDVGAMVERRGFALAGLRDSNVVPGVLEAVQHRRVLREKQRGNQQQWTEQSGHFY